MYDSGGGNGDGGNSSGEGSASEAAGGGRRGGIDDSGLVATVLRRPTRGAERPARRERRGGEGGERSNEGARDPRGPGKERAGSTWASRHMQGGVAGGMRVR